MPARNSAEINRALTEEARAVIGRSRVRVPADRPRPGHRDPPPPPRRAPADRFAFVQIGVAAIGVGAIIALITGEGWLLPIAALLVAIATTGIVAVILRMTSQN